MTGIRRHSDWSTLLLYTLLAIAAGVLLTLPFSRGIQWVIMAKFHLRTESYGAWSFTQALPNMYSFDNKIVMQEPVRGELWVSHYPLQMVTDPWNRYIYFWRDGKSRLELRSSYRATSLTTSYRLSADGHADVDGIGTDE